LKYLPTYSPNLNLIERVWKFYKKKVLENIYYEDFESFLNSTYKFFKDIHIYSIDIKKLPNQKFEIISAD